MNCIYLYRILCTKPHAQSNISFWPIERMHTRQLNHFYLFKSQAHICIMFNCYKCRFISIEFTHSLFSRISCKTDSLDIYLIYYCCIPTAACHNSSNFPEFNWSFLKCKTYIYRSFVIAKMHFCFESTKRHTLNERKRKRTIWFVVATTHKETWSQFALNILFSGMNDLLFINTYHFIRWPLLFYILYFVISSKTTANIIYLNAFAFSKRCLHILFLCFVFIQVICIACLCARFPLSLSFSARKICIPKFFHSPWIEHKDR